MNQVRLKPCPFCGGEAELVEQDFAGHTRVFVVCTKCKSHGQSHMEGHTVAFKGIPSRYISAEICREKAIGAWNKRAVKSEGGNNMQEQRMIYTESICGYPFRTVATLAEEFSMCKSTVRSRLKEIEAEVKNGRYTKHAVVRDGKIVLANAIVFIDYITYRKMLLDKNARKYVPEFKPEIIVREIGWSNRIVVEEDTA